MPVDAAERSPQEPLVQEFARAFRAAARAVSFYPPAHQAVVSALEQVVAAAHAAAADGPLCLTVLPRTLLARGVAIDASQTAVSAVADICHRHGVGAISLDGRDTSEAWRALLGLLARKPDEVRSTGGIQRQWKDLRHVSPAVLEIDFGALLRGQVGGDFNELAGVISHYLETAGVGGSILDDPCGALRRAIESAADDAAAVEAVLRELRAAAQLTWSQPDQFDDVFCRAAEAGEFLGVGVLRGLLDSLGSAGAMVGRVDVVSALVDRMPDAIVSGLMSRIMGAADIDAAGLANLFTRLVSDAGRRRAIVNETHGVTLAANVAEQWADLERSLQGHLESQTDPRFVSDDYLDELHAVQVRADRLGNDPAAPAELRAAWLRSIGDEAVRENDSLLLADLARLETEFGRALKVLAILQAHALDAAGDGDWRGVACAVELIGHAASESADGLVRDRAAEVLQRLSRAPWLPSALEMLPEAAPATADALVRVLSRIGGPLLPAVAARWAADCPPALRASLERIVGESGRKGREPLRRLIASDTEPPNLRVAAIRLLELTPGVDHLPALEAVLSDRHDEVRRAAVRALAGSSSARAIDVLARRLATSDAPSREVLLTGLMAEDGRHALPVLQRVLSQVDPRKAPMPMYLSIIAAVGRTGLGEAAPVLASVIQRASWSAPLRAWRFRSAAKAALRALGGPAAGSGPMPPAAAVREARRASAGEERPR